MRDTNPWWWHRRARLSFHTVADAHAVRVLVVEDDPLTRKMLATFLTEEGFMVATAHDGAHALRVAAASAPDVIVLDIGLPVLDGSGFALRWRQRPGAQHVPIIAISALAYGDELAREIGVVSFHPKPFDLDLLVTDVRRVAERRRSAADAP